MGGDGEEDGWEIDRIFNTSDCRIDESCENIVVDRVFWREAGRDFLLDESSKLGHFGKFSRQLGRIDAIIIITGITGICLLFSYMSFLGHAETKFNVGEHDFQ